MNDNFTDRLLDASLKEYSRVSPPEDFASRVLAKRVLGKDVPRPTRLTWLGWLAIPAAAAALACGILMMRPVPVAPRPLRLAEQPHPALFIQPTLVAAVKKPSRAPEKPPFHVLTGVELARMTLPAELFAPPEEKPVSEIVIAPLNVAPLEIPSIPDSRGEK